MNALTFSQIKEIKSFCEDLFSTPAWREVVEQIVEGEIDFEVDNVRFINADVIDSVLADELAGDEYALGCFNASFIAEVTGWPEVLIKAGQSGEAYSQIGQALIDGGFVEDMAKAYATADGYGHHFNSYDSGEEELSVSGFVFHVFDNH